MDDDFKYYGDYLYFREYPDAPDAYDLEGMQLAMGSRGQSAEQRQKFENQPMADYVVGEAKEAAKVVGGGMADIGAASVKGVGQGFGGIFGDVEMLGRGIKEIYNRGGDETKLDAFLRGIQEETILPTTEDIKKWLDTNVGKVGAGDNPYETVGEMLAPGGYVKAAKTTAKGVKSLAPVAGEMFETYAARTGLTNYITDPVKVYSGVMVQDIQPKRRLNTLVTKLESGRIDEQTYIENTKLLNEAMQKKPEKVSDADKVRGADEVTRRLLGALNPNAQVKLREPIVRFAKWLLDNNPQFGNELGISIKGTGEKGTAGGYASWDRVATIFADKANDATGVHEILHHTEQMMPIEVQNGITDEWTRSYLATYQKADPKVQLYLKEIPKAIAGDKKAQKTIFEGFKNGTLNYDAHYQFVNPSEFWAVNATRIMNSRYEAGSWIAKAKVWLGEFTEKAKGAFGVPSDSQVLRGLKAISKGKGELESDLLAEPINVSSSARRVKQQREQSQQRKRVAKGAAAVTAAGAALTGDEGQK
jgi:hypothetical protein